MKPKQAERREKERVNDPGEPRVSKKPKKDKLERFWINSAYQSLQCHSMELDRNGQCPSGSHSTNEKKWAWRQKSWVQRSEENRVLIRSILPTPLPPPPLSLGRLHLPSNPDRTGILDPEHQILLRSLTRVERPGFLSLSGKLTMI